MGGGREGKRELQGQQRCSALALPDYSSRERQALREWEKEGGLTFHRSGPH